MPWKPFQLEQITKMKPEYFSSQNLSIYFALSAYFTLFALMKTILITFSKVLNLYRMNVNLQIGF